MGIIMVSIPPHTPHRLQPLDVTFFGPFKNSFSQQCHLFLKSKIYNSDFENKVTPYDLAEIFKLAYEKVANIDKGVSGFKTCGIFPVDPTKFSDSDFAPAENFNETSISLPSLTNIARSKVQSSQPSTSRQIEQTPRAQSPQPSTSRQIEQTPRAQSPQPSTSRQIEQTPRAQLPQRLTSRQSPVQTTPTKRVLSNISNIQTMKHVPIVLISPVPVPRGKTKKNPRPKQHSEILTSTPFKEKSIEKKRIKMEKANAAKTNLRISSETKENKMKTKTEMKGKQKKHQR
ncbi:hypothetical protein JTB14_028948 [Gonioctena quinquepunctata]|nr:hypothetical protein JTB14_028948 [Gonioctena quinquepunctata]